MALFLPIPAQARKQDPVKPYWDRGLACQKLGQNKQALESLNKALHIYPDQDFTLLLRANLYLSQRIYDKALQDCDAYLVDEELDPSGLAKARRFKGNILIKAGRYKNAVTELTTAAEGLQGTEKGQALYLRAYAYEKLGRNDRAAADRKLSSSLGCTNLDGAEDGTVAKFVHIWRLKSK